MDETSFWVAQVETRNTRSLAFGTTPEGAVEALVRLWIERHCPASGADPAYLWEINDEIEVGKAAVGMAVILAGDDRLWFAEAVSGDDPSLEETWDSLSSQYGVHLATPEDASAYLRRSFAELADAIGRDGVDFGENHSMMTKALDTLGVLAAEDPDTVDADALVEAATELNATFDMLRLRTYVLSEPGNREARRAHALDYQTRSFHVKRFSEALAQARKPEEPGPA